MEYNAVNTLTIQLEGDEISHFFTVLAKLKKKTRQVGFKRDLSTEERLLIEDMYYKLVGDEEDINQDKQQQVL